MARNGPEVRVAGSKQEPHQKTRQAIAEHTLRRHGSGLSLSQEARAEHEFRVAHRESAACKFRQQLGVVAVVGVQESHHLRRRFPGIDQLGDGDKPPEAGGPVAAPRLVDDGRAMCQTPPRPSRPSNRC